MTAIKERPILFSGPMVRAILEGRKTVTRRVLSGTGQGWEFGLNEPGMSFGTINSPHPKRGKFGVFVRRELSTGNGKYERDVVVCPYGKPGDRLWVRETWSVEMLAGYSEEGGYSSEYELRYRADDGEREISVAAGVPDPWLNLYDSQRGEWRPSIHMPRAACRILLEITAVRVERLQDISDEQAMAEGISALPCGRFHCWHDEEGPVTSRSPVTAFAWLWNSINGESAWSENPWVWVVEFKRVEQ